MPGHILESGPWLPPPDLDPCENYPHRYDPALQIYLPLCVNEEPLGAPWVLPNAHVLVPFEASFFANLHEPYFAHLMTQLQPGITQFDGYFLLLDVNETDERLFAVGRCPHDSQLGAIAFDDSGRLHALCRRPPGLGEPIVVHGIYDQETSTFRWDVPLPAAQLDLNHWIALGMVGGLPVVMSGVENFATLLFMRPSSSMRSVESLFGAFASARDLLVIHAQQVVERPGYFRMRVNPAGPSGDSPLAFSRTAGTLLPTDAGMPFGPNEPPVLAVEHSGQLLLPLPKLEPYGSPPEQGSPGFVLPLHHVTPVGGVRSAGGGVFVHGADRDLVFDCGGGQRITLSQAETRLSRASCTEARCLVVYFEPFQPTGVERWLRGSFHVRRIERATCTD